MQRNINVSNEGFQKLTEAEKLLATLVSLPDGDITGNATNALVYLKRYLNEFYGASEWDIEDNPSECEILMGARYFEAPVNRIKKGLENLQKIVADEGIDQTVIVEEECTELIKEICKLRRGKGNREHLLEEACDVAIACLVYNQVCGGTIEDFLDRARNKINRAINDYEKDGIV